MRAIAVVAGLLVSARVAAEPVVVVVPAEDTRTHAIASRRFVAVSSWLAHLREADASAAWLQIGVGPARWKLPFRGASMGELDRWTMRLRFGRVLAADRPDVWAPLTVAAQRLSVHDTLSILPFIHLQTGLELAVSTPWLSDRELDPRMVGAGAYSADTELARNGWSLRPATWHVRADALLCRSIHVEAGVGPEVFRSTLEPDRALDFGLRWRFSLGFSLACDAIPKLPLDDITVALQYNARALVHNRDADPAYDDRLYLTLAYQPRASWFSIAGFTTPDARIVGARVQIEAGGPR